MAFVFVSDQDVLVFVQDDNTYLSDVVSDSDDEQIEKGLVEEERETSSEEEGTPSTSSSGAIGNKQRVYMWRNVKKTEQQYLILCSKTTRL